MRHLVAFGVISKPVTLEVKRKLLSRVRLCDMDPPGSSVHGIFQARILQWVAISVTLRREEITAPLKLLICSNWSKEIENDSLNVLEVC